MHYRSMILLACFFFAFAAERALANDDGFVVWDQNIASAVSARLLEEDRCSDSPYALYGPNCHRELNLGFDRPAIYFTLLDRAALFLYKYHRLNYNQRLWKRTKLKFELNLKNLYEQEARARIELRYRFSDGRLGSGLLPGSGGVDLHHPSFYENQAPRADRSPGPFRANQSPSAGSARR